MGNSYSNEPDLFIKSTLYSEIVKWAKSPNFRQWDGYRNDPNFVYWDFFNKRACCTGNEEFLLPFPGFAYSDNATKDTSNNQLDLTNPLFNKYFPRIPKTMYKSLDPYENTVFSSVGIPLKIDISDETCTVDNLNNNIKQLTNILSIVFVFILKNKNIIY